MDEQLMNDSDQENNSGDVFVSSQRKKRKKNPQTARKSTASVPQVRPLQVEINRIRAELNEDSRTLRSSTRNEVGLGRGKGGAIRLNSLDATNEHPSFEQPSSIQQSHGPPLSEPGSSSESDSPEPSPPPRQTRPKGIPRRILRQSPPQRPQRPCTPPRSPSVSSSSSSDDEQPEPSSRQHNLVDINNNEVESRSNAEMLRAAMRARDIRALREIRRIENDTAFSIPRSVFQRNVREVASALVPDMRFQTSALTALQTAAETFLVHLYEHASLATIHAKRVTLFVKDIHLTQRISGGTSRSLP